MLYCVTRFRGIDTKNKLNLDGFVKSPISAKASLRACVALHTVAIAAYYMYASSHRIRDALNLNFLLCRLKHNFVRVHHLY
jgi:hypothetical protein